MQGTEVPAMQRGNLEMSTMTTFEVEQQIPEFSVFSTGYLFRDYGHMKAVFASPIGAEYAKKVEEVMGIKILQPFYLGTPAGQSAQGARREGTGRPERREAARAGWTGLARLARGLGVSPTPMAMPEVYLALSTGTIDGQENPLSIMRANKLEEVTQQIVLTSHLVQPVFLAMALPIWNKLSADDQAKAMAAAKVAADANDKARIAEEKSIVDELQAKGLKIARPDTALFRKAVMAQYESSGLKAKWPAGMYERIEQVKYGRRRTHAAGCDRTRGAGCAPGVRGAWCRAARAGPADLHVRRHQPLRVPPSGGMGRRDRDRHLPVVDVPGRCVHGHAQGNVAFDMIYTALPAKGQRVMLLAGSALVALLLAWATPAVYAYVAFLTRERTPVLEWPLNVVYSCVVVFFVVTVVRELWRCAVLMTPKWREHL